MLFQFCAECLGCLYAWHHPKRVSEDATVLIVGIWIEAVLVILAHQIQELFHILVVNKGTIIFSAEELTEVERLFIFHKLTHQIAQVVSVYVDGWQRSIRIRLVWIICVPSLLCFLLHHIVPSVDFLFAVIVEQVERSA